MVSGSWATGGLDQRSHGLGSGGADNRQHFQALGRGRARDTGAVDGVAGSPPDMLLILDNCEHLVQACAEIAEQLLHHCWQLHILATSREELRIPGEVVLPVLPLALPDIQERIPAHLLSAPAVQLFVERIDTAPFQRKVPEDDAITIAHICRQLTAYHWHWSLPRHSRAACHLHRYQCNCRTR